MEEIQGAHVLWLLSLLALPLSTGEVVQGLSSAAQFLA